MRCENSKRFCNLCHFAKDIRCYESEIQEFRNGVKEAVFFTHPLVPEHLVYENMHNTIVRFDRNCTAMHEYTSDYPPYSNHTYTVQCIPCTSGNEVCAIQYGLSRKESVLKLYSV